MDPCVLSLPTPLAVETLPQCPTGSPRCVVQSSDGTWTRSTGSDRKVHKENLGDYPQLLAALASLDMRYVVDAGANDGFSTWLFARALPNATVVAIEPGKENYAMTLLNTRSLPNVHAVHAALWNNGSRTLQLAGQRMGEWAISAHEPGELRHARPPVIEMTPTVELGSLMRAACFPRLDFLKVDIEGGEKLVLSDEPEWLRSVRFYYMEVHPGGEPFLRHILGALLRANMTVLTNPTLRHPGYPPSRPHHEWVFFACGLSVAPAQCMEVCEQWRRGTGLQCSTVRHPADFWGSPHRLSDCELTAIGMDAAKAAANCRETAVK